MKKAERYFYPAVFTYELGQEYDDIPGTEDVRLIGKVIGKVEEN